MEMAGLKTKIILGVAAALIILAAIAVFLSLHQGLPPGRARGPLVQEVYIWQRLWGEELLKAVRLSAPSFRRLVVLCAEISFEKGKPRVVQVPVDHKALAAAGQPVGLALRVGPYQGSFDRDGEAARRICAVAAGMVAKARAGKIEPSEVQIDFDCAESKLDGYRTWIEAARQAVSPVPLALTTLPSWLDRPAFQELAAAAGAFILQVHALQRPAGPDSPLVLCNPAAARRWVEEAAKVGVPFRVALPTYGYQVAFGSNGKYLGLRAEGPRPPWPQDAVIRETQADPKAMAALLRAWTEDRPVELSGVIWYRLPLSSDVFNWRWPTLQAVMDGRAPEPSPGPR